jgi:SAM-dependent methyltransferase
MSGSCPELTWQAIIENGFALEPSSKKDPKYVTHGLHPYKGKFYPQLAKALTNLCNLKAGDKILDPFCGSGTTLLESYLNGYCGYGCDMNPLAAKIARAKVGILKVNLDVLRETAGTLINIIEHGPEQCPYDRSEFSETCIAEIERWFPIPVIDKLNWILKNIRRVSQGVVLDFLEIILSSIIREISHQDPNDLRIRRRKDLLEDADLFSMYVEALDRQYKRISKFWSILGYSPSKFQPAKAIEGDSRRWATFEELGVKPATIDLVLTSPPYATALPYIDTDRLSLLVLFGLDSSKRRPIEQQLVGSREIITSERKYLEDCLVAQQDKLPSGIVNYLRDLHTRVSTAEVGFRRKNMPALLFRFFSDMNEVLTNCFSALRPGGEAMIVIGDNRLMIDDDYERVATTDFVEQIALRCGFSSVERIDISVTTENMIHNKNAITENVVLRLKRP